MDKNRFAVTPPMGWNSYDYYDTTVNEEQIRKNADYMAANLKEYGWEYIVADIQWYAHGAGSRRAEHQYIPFSKLEMDEYGRLQPDPERFPSSKGGAGFKPLADYVHNLGLKFGIHIMRGVPRIAAHNHMPVWGTDTDAGEIADPSSICGWNPDMYGVRNTPAGQAYYDSIISMYADWGVDFIKCDDICDSWMYRHDSFNGWFETEMLHNAIMKSGREIVLSLSPGPAHIDRAWKYAKNANMWRITDDFWDNWPLLKNMFYRCELWQDHVTEGCYPDCDMLPLGYVGKGFEAERVTNFTKEEQRTMMTLWCIFGSPLMLGAEMTKLDDWTLSLLTNREVLAMLTPDCKANQICLDKQKSIWMASNVKVGSHYVALFNLQDEEAEVSVALAEAGLQTGVSLKELWTGAEVKAAEEIMAVKLPAHGCVVYRVV